MQGPQFYRLTIAQCSGWRSLPLKQRLNLRFVKVNVWVTTVSLCFNFFLNITKSPSLFTFPKYKYSESYSIFNQVAGNDERMLQIIIFTKGPRLQKKRLRTTGLKNYTTFKITVNHRITIIYTIYLREL